MALRPCHCWLWTRAMGIDGMARLSVLAPPPVFAERVAETASRTRMWHETVSSYYRAPLCCSGSFVFCRGCMTWTEGADVSEVEEWTMSGWDLTRPVSGGDVGARSWRRCWKFPSCAGTKVRRPCPLSTMCGLDLGDSLSVIRAPL